MTHQSVPSSAASARVDAGRQVAQLREVLVLVCQLAGRSAPEEPAEAALDESARLAAAYDAAMPILQRRFDALAAETAAWAAAGVAALLAAGRVGEPPKAAAATLADELEKALGRLAKLLRL
jgi:hypothetical protein